MANLMPLVHQARRTIRNRQDGNPFATDEVIADLIDVRSAPPTSRHPTGAFPARSSGAGPLDTLISTERPTPRPDRVCPAGLGP